MRKNIPFSMNMHERLAGQLADIMDRMDTNNKSKAVEVMINILHTYYLYDNPYISLKDEFDAYNFADGRKERWKNKHA